jgi:hypothetical protein
MAGTRDIYTLTGTTNANSLLTRADGDARYAAKGGAGGAWGSITGVLANQIDLKAALDNLQSQITSSGGSGTWGGISGTLSNQTDLQTALNALQPLIPAGTTAQYYRGDKTWATLNSAAVGLGNVDNTSDLSKPISNAVSTALAGKASTSTFTSSTAGIVPASGGGTTSFLRADGTWAVVSSGGGAGTWGSITGTLSAQTDLQTALGAKEGTISAGTTGQYWRGDKTWQTLDKTAVGLGNVSNVAQEPAITAGLTSQYWRGDKSWQTLDKTAVGLSNVDNTSDASKPVSTAQQTALNLKASLTGATFSGAISATNLSGTNTGDQTITLTGDVTGSGTGSFATAIGSNKVTRGMLAATAGATLLGATAAGNVSDLTAAQAKAFLAITGADVSGLATVATSGSASDLASGTLAAARLPAFSGDVSSGAGTASLAIGANKVTNAMLAQVATGTFHGRTSAGTGNVETLTGTQATALLDNFTTSLKGLVPASGGGTTNYLRADGSWSPMSVIWGNITGTLSNQTDLQTTLNAKASLAGATFTGAVDLYQTEQSDAANTIAASTQFVQNSHTFLTHTTTGGASTIVANNQARGGFIIQGTLTSNATVSLTSSTTATFIRFYTIVNNTTGSYTLTFQASSTPGATITVAQGSPKIVYVKGNDVFEIGASFNNVPNIALVGSSLSAAVNYNTLTQTLGYNFVSINGTVPAYANDFAASNSIVISGTYTGAGVPIVYLSASGSSAATFGRVYTIQNTTSQDVTIKACDTSPTGSVVVTAGLTALVRTNGASISGLSLTSTGGTAAWGSITGTLSSQTDLQSALDLKAPKASPTFTGTVTLPSQTYSNQSDFGSTEAATKSFAVALTYLTTISTTGGSTTLDASQQNRGIIRITGALTSNATIYLSTGSFISNQRVYTLVNDTSGAFTVTFKACDTGPVNGIAVAQGSNAQVYGMSATLYQVGSAGGGGTTTNSITFNTSGGAAAGTTFNGSAAKTIDYSTVGAAAATHTHAYTDVNNIPTGNLLYRKTAGTGAAEVQTLATLKTDLGLTGTNSGDESSSTILTKLSGASGGGTTNYLRADGTWAAPATGGGYTNIDGGNASSSYGSITNINGGTA